MFYGWRVVSGAFVAQMFVLGFFAYSASLLVAPVRAEFDASLEQVMYSLGAGTVLGLVVTPIAGIMIDRFPVRWLMVAGTIVFSAGLWAIAQSESISEYVILFGLTMALANGFAGAMSASTVISRWFTVSRGRALGIAALGTSAGGIIVPKLISSTLVDSSWRVALEQLSMWSLIIMLPIVILTIRGKPTDVGLTAEASGSAAQPSSELDRPMSLKQIVINPGYWFLGLSLGLLFSSYSAVLANISPYAINLGETEARAASLIMTIAIAGIVGKLLFGLAADKFSLKAGLGVAEALVIVGLLIFSLEESDYIYMLLASSALGLAAGGMLPIWGALTVHIFGLANFGKAMGLMTPLITLCILPGYALIGRLYDSSGSYSSAMLIFSALMVLAILLLIPLKLRDS
ncbi:MAG: MFS family permease [Halioglobus sp.]|jgi:MFS family permease